MTSRRRHLILFVKEPRLGRVKRRLARDVGAIEALRFYEATLSSLVRRLAPGPWHTWLAVTPDASAHRMAGWSRWLGQTVSVIGQGTGDIGARMRRALATMPPGPAVLIGGDIPEVAPRHIEDAFHILGSRDCVFGPARDGGYWLVGLRRSPASPDVFSNVRWSSPYTLEDTIAALPPGLRYGLVETLEDVDDGGAYMRWREGHLRAGGVPPLRRKA